MLNNRRRLLKFKAFTSSWVINLTRFVVESDSSKWKVQLRAHRNNQWLATEFTTVMGIVNCLNRRRELYISIYFLFKY